MATKIKELESLMCRPLYCDICRTRLSGPAPAQQHYSSKNHQKKADVLLRIGTFETFGIKSGEHFCKACRVAYTSKNELQDHFQSMEHREMCQREENPVGLAFGGANIFLDAIQNGVDTRNKHNDSLGIDRHESKILVATNTSVNSNGISAAEKSVENKSTIDASEEFVNCQIDKNFVDDVRSPQATSPGSQIMSTIGDIALHPGTSTQDLNKEFDSRAVENDIAEEQDKDKEYEMSPLGRGKCLICKVVLTSHKLAKEHLNGRNHKNARNAWLLRKHCSARAAKDIIRNENVLVEEANEIENSTEETSSTKNQKNCKLHNHVDYSATENFKHRTNLGGARNNPTYECKGLQDKDTSSFVGQTSIAEASFLISLRSDIGDNVNNSPIELQKHVGQDNNELHAIQCRDTLEQSLSDSINSNARDENIERASKSNARLIKEMDKVTQMYPENHHLLSRNILAKDPEGFNSAAAENINLLTNAVDKSIQCPSINMLTAKRVAVGSERDRRVWKSDCSSNITTTSDKSARAWNEGPLCGISLSQKQSRIPVDSDRLANIWMHENRDSNNISAKNESVVKNPGLNAWSLVTDDSFSQMITRPSLRNDTNDFTRIITSETRKNEIKLPDSSCAEQLGLANLTSAFGPPSIQNILCKDNICPGSEEDISRFIADGDNQRLFEELVRNINSFTLPGNSVSPINNPITFSNNVPHSPSICSSASDNTNLTDNTVPIGYEASNSRVVGRVSNETFNILPKDGVETISTITNENGPKLSTGPKVSPTTPPGFKPLDHLSTIPLTPFGSSVAFNNATRNQTQKMDEATGNSAVKSLESQLSTDRTIWHQCHICLKKLNSSKQLETHMSSHNGLAESNVTCMPSTLGYAQTANVTDTAIQTFATSSTTAKTSISSNPYDYSNVQEESKNSNAEAKEKSLSTLELYQRLMNGEATASIIPKSNISSQSTLRRLLVRKDV